jgi:hypothetical protein
MNASDLQSLGLQMPSPAYLLGLIVFGIVGYAAFRRGRKSGRPALTGVGVATMVYPYAVSQTWLLWLIGCAATAWIVVKWN